MSKIILELKDGEPCNHSGCLHHVSHPCEGCGRIAGRLVNKWIVPKKMKKLNKQIINKSNIER